METNALIFPAFYDWQELVIDDKKRLLLPADFRRSLNPEINGSWLFIKPTGRKTISISPSKTYEYQGQQRILTLGQGQDVTRESLLHFALASRVEMDKQGRILIPEKMLNQTGIGKEVVLAGMQDHMEIFTREAWKRATDGLLSESQA